MNEIISFFNSNSGAVQGISTIILIIITFFYALQTKRTVDLMQKTEKERNRPRMAVYLDQRESRIGLVDIIVANLGQGQARDIDFHLSGDLDLIQKDHKLSQLMIIQNGIKDFVPGRVLRITTISLIGKLEQYQNEILKITVSYSDLSGRERYEDEYILDFNALIEHELGKPPIYKIAENIEKVAKSLAKIEQRLEK